MSILARALIAVAAAVLMLLASVVPVSAQQFYNPWHFHHTRQQMTNRAVARRVARSRTRTTRRAVRPKRTSPTTTKKPPVKTARR